MFHDEPSLVHPHSQIWRYTESKSSLHDSLIPVSQGRSPDRKENAYDETPVSS